MNMGNYAHGNQPIQHMIYLYNYAGEPWKTQYHVREVLDKLYNYTPDGYCGDEDNGQTSAWYVFSALGFYPVTPGTGEYVLGSPLFDRITLSLKNGKRFVVESKDNSRENVYVQKVKLFGKEMEKNYITHVGDHEGRAAAFQDGSGSKQEQRYRTRGVSVFDEQGKIVDTFKFFVIFVALKSVLLRHLSTSSDVLRRLKRGVAQLASAPRSGRGGRKFESSHPDKRKSLARKCRALFFRCVESLLSKA